jgi:hypothetical protein
MGSRSACALRRTLRRAFGTQLRGVGVRELSAVLGRLCMVSVARRDAVAISAAVGGVVYTYPAPCMWMIIIR